MPCGAGFGDSGADPDQGGYGGAQCADRQSADLPYRQAAVRREKAAGSADDELLGTLSAVYLYAVYAAFLLTRGYEGKALLANISIPAVLYAAVWLWQETEEKRLWAVLFLVSLSALCFSVSSIIFPAVLAAECFR